MNATVESLNLLLALGGVGFILASAVLVFDLYTSRSLEVYVQKWGLFVAFLLTATGTGMTLIYSEVFGFVPCSLCWFQRIFLYPQLFITGTALYIKEKMVALYGIALSVPGLIISLYQHYIQMGGSEVVGCPTGGGDCSQRILFEFGFMTFPLVSASLFFFLIVLYFYMHKAR